MESESAQREIETMILGYLFENGYSHSAFTFDRESRMGPLSLDKLSPGELLFLVDKGRQMVAIEQEGLTQSMEAILGEQPDSGPNPSLKAYIDHRITLEASALLPREKPAEQGGSSRTNVEGARLFRQGGNVLIFANGFRLCARVALERGVSRGTVTFSQVSDSLRSSKYHVSFLRRHLLLAVGGSVAVFSVSDLICTKRLCLPQAADRPLTVRDCGSFIALGCQTHLFLLSEESAEPLRCIPVASDKIGCIGPFVYLFSLAENQLSMFSLLDEALVRLELPKEHQLVNFEVNETGKFLIVLSEAGGEKHLFWFAGGKTKKMGEAALKGSYSRIRFGHSLEKFVLYSEGGFSVFDNKTMSVEDSIKVPDQIANLEFLEDRVLVESPSNTFKSFKQGQTGYFDHPKADPGSNMIFVPELNSLAEFFADSYTLTPLL